MTTRAIATLVAPTRSITFAAVYDDLLLEDRDFAAAVVAARTEPGHELEAPSMSWTFSATLAAPYSYLSASTSTTGISFTRELRLAEPVIEVVVDLIPWSARAKKWSKASQWNFVSFSAVSLYGDSDLTLTGLAKLEVRS